ncbi:MAG: response regulator [Halieaceae bacterium]|jgi:PAS domain S-box-containing protein|nr:response regulator [Halieaceae bacterium]
MPLSKKLFDTALRPATIRLSLVIWALLLLVLALIYWRVTATEKALATEAFSRYQSDAIVSGQAILNGEFGRAIDDLRLVANNPAVRAWMADPTEANRSQLSALLRDIVASRAGKVLQMRHLDTSGMEIARADYLDGRSVAIASSALQDKSDRYYFREAMRLAPGGIYLSPLDLNQENGKVQRPFVPTIRAAMAIANSAGGVGGIAITNLRAGPWLERLRDSGDPRYTEIWVLNEQGDWLLGPDPDSEWGFMFPDRDYERFVDRFPACFAAMQNGAFCQASESESGAILTTVEVDPSEALGGAAASGTRHLYLVAFSSRDVFDRFLRRELSGINAVFGLLAILLGGLSHLIASLAQRERQQLKAAITREHEVTRILNAAPDVILIVDEQGKIQEFNDKAMTMLGYSAEELKALPVETLVPEHTRASHPGKRAISHAAGDAPPAREMAAEIDIQVEVVCKDGSELPVSVVLSRISQDAGQRVIVAIRDMTTELARREALENAKNVAENASRAKSDFLATMSHEIRTPLNTIIGNLNLLKRDNLTAEQAEDLQSIENASDALLALINDVLDFAKIEAGELQLEHTEFSLAAIASTLKSVFRGQAQKKGIGFNVEVQPAIETRLFRGDPTRINQVLFNLISNAIKFTSEGSVTVALRIMEATEHHATIELQITDTGIGIKAEAVERLFSPFIQENTSINRRYGGTGLGLSIVKRLLDLMDGTIAVDSVPDRGTAMTVKLPLAFASDHPDADTLQNRISILIAEDNEIDRRLLLQLCERLHWQAEAVESSGALIAKLRLARTAGELPDCLLLDWHMPHMDGLTALQQLESELSPEEMPAVVMITAMDPQLAEMALAEAGPRIMLHKPADGSALFNAVNAAVVAKGLDPRMVLESSHIDPDIGKWLEGIRVMVVDDVAANLTVASRLLEREGAIAETYGDASTAIDALIAEPKRADVILMDLQMPDIDGYQASRKLREQVGWQGPIVALTAGATASEQSAAMDAGMNDYMTKPYDPATLVRTIRRLVKTRAQAQTPQLNQDRLQPQNTGDSCWVSIRGVDSASAEKNFAGDIDLYRELVETFMATVPAALTEIESLIAGDERDALRQAVHKLRGQLGTLGAMQYHEQAGNVEAALVNGFTYQIELEGLLVYVRDLAEGMNEWLKSQSAEV